MSDHKSRTAETPDEDPRGESPTTDDELKEASHAAMIGHLDGTPNDELRELIEEWRVRGHDPYGMTWLKPADELEEVIEDE